MTVPSMSHGAARTAVELDFPRYSKERPAPRDTEDRRHRAAIVLQCAWRSFLAREELMSRVMTHCYLVARVLAATLVQRVWRGFKVRSSVLVRLTWPSSDGRSIVFVAGGFAPSRWAAPLRMTYDDERREFYRVIRVPSSRSDCQFKFHVDGFWRCNDTFDITQDEMGNNNNRIAVPSVAAMMRPAAAAAAAASSSSSSRGSRRVPSGPAHPPAAAAQRW
eukprot:GHVU01010145.1.p1 GENE.GHVU01010145.1~~GHVU01010145.1.p1  ORF type:complete len:220 (-),score=35.20 GHVU01010145.1:257-916(-)